MKADLFFRKRALRGVMTAVAVLLPMGAAAQDLSMFEAELGDCARYITAQPETRWDFQTPAFDVDEGEGGIRGTVVYPQGSAGGFDFAISFDWSKGTSTTPGSWTCSGAGPASPTWPLFTSTGWIGADARLRSNGLQELNFPGPQKAYANCGADVPNVYWLFNAGEGDRVVFAAVTGPTAAAFCGSMGVKG